MYMGWLTRGVDAGRGRCMTGGSIKTTSQCRRCAVVVEGDGTRGRCALLCGWSVEADEQLW